MIIVTVNTSNLKDLLQDDNIKSIAEESAIGLMNSKSYGRNSQYKPYLTLGAGDRAEVYAECAECYKVEGSMNTKYRNITLHPVRDGEIANMWINRIVELNKNTYYGAVPGRLGSILRSNNIKTGFIGGFLSEGKIKSPAFFILMDNFGLADTGEIEGVFKDGIFDYDSVFQAYMNIRETADFIVIELGEAESLFVQKKLYSEESYNAAMREVMGRAGSLIKKIISSSDFSDSLLCIMSPYSYDISYPGMDILSPIIIYNNGKYNGVLISKTTRREGLISALDFAPFVLQYYGIEPEGFTGYTINSIQRGEKLEYISLMDRDTKCISISRPPLLKGFAVLIIVTAAAFIIMIVSGRYRGYGIISFLMMFYMFIPFSMLSEGLFSISGIFMKALFIIVLSFICTAGVYKFIKGPEERILSVLFINAAALFADLISGQRMQKYSILSYDSIIGARYYGLGNEYLGVMIACTLIICGFLINRDKRFKKLSALLLIFTVLVIGLPWLGSNVGGFVTASFTFMFFILQNCGYSFKRALKYSAFAALFAMLMVILSNLISKNLESHLGKTLNMVREDDGFLYVVNMAARKVKMGLKLIRYTIWSRVLIAVITASAVLYIKPGGYRGSTLLSQQYIKNLWASIIIGSTASILLNDSGIVTAAIIMSYSLFCIVLMFRSNDRG